MTPCVRDWHIYQEFAPCYFRPEMSEEDDALEAGEEGEAEVPPADP